MATLTWWRTIVMTSDGKPAGTVYDYDALSELAERIGIETEMGIAVEDWVDGKCVRVVFAGFNAEQQRMIEEFVGHQLEYEHADVGDYALCISEIAFPIDPFDCGCRSQKYSVRHPAMSVFWCGCPDCTKAMDAYRYELEYAELEQDEASYYVDKDGVRRQCAVYRIQNCDDPMNDHAPMGEIIAGLRRRDLEHGCPACRDLVAENASEHGVVQQLMYG